MVIVVIVAIAAIVVIVMVVMEVRVKISDDADGDDAGCFLAGSAPVEGCRVVVGISCTSGI